MSDLYYMAMYYGISVALRKEAELTVWDEFETFESYEKRNKEVFDEVFEALKQEMSYELSSSQMLTIVEWTAKCRRRLEIIRFQKKQYAEKMKLEKNYGGCDGL